MVATVGQRDEVQVQASQEEEALKREAREKARAEEAAKKKATEERQRPLQVNGKPINYDKLPKEGYKSVGGLNVRRGDKDGEMLADGKKFTGKVITTDAKGNQETLTVKNGVLESVRYTDPTGKETPEAKEGFKSEPPQFNFEGGLGQAVNKQRESQLGLEGQQLVTGQHIAPKGNVVTRAAGKLKGGVTGAVDSAKASIAGALRSAANEVDGRRSEESQGAAPAASNGAVAERPQPSKDPKDLARVASQANVSLEGVIPGGDSRAAIDPAHQAQQQQQAVGQ